MNKEETVESLLSIAKTIGYGKVPKLQQNEYFTTGAFDLIVFNCQDRSRNFSLMSSLCGRYEQIKKDKKFLKGYIYLLDQLSYSTNTSEKPEGIKKIIEENPNETESLQVWYNE